MKIIIRSLVIALALTGAIATTYAKAPSATAKAQAPVSLSKTSAIPVPGCDPSTDDCD